MAVTQPHTSSSRYPRLTFPDVKVLSITGCTRSGRTLLDTILGSIQGFFSTGERLPVGARSRARSALRLRGADSAMPHLVHDPREGLSRGDTSPELVIALQEESARTRHTPRLLAAERGRDQTPALAAYAVRRHRERHGSIRDRRLVQAAVGRRDRPARPGRQRIRSTAASRRHIVRDPRAVVHSWSRTKAELDRPGAASMPKQSLLSTAFGWAELNAMSELVRRRYGDRATLIRYEDLARDAAGYLTRVLEVVEESRWPLPLIGADGVRVGANHTVSGNPGRFHTGGLSIRPDEAWRSATTGPRHAAITILTMPLLLRYGYGLGRGVPG